MDDEQVLGLKPLHWSSFDRACDALLVKRTYRGTKCYVTLCDIRVMLRAEYMHPAMYFVGVPYLHARKDFRLVLLLHRYELVHP